MHGREVGDLMNRFVNPDNDFVASSAREAIKYLPLNAQIANICCFSVDLNSSHCRVLHYSLFG
jgi:hypothetical protein